MLTRKSVCKVIAWMRKYNLIVDEHKLFQVAYYEAYKKADARCEYCFDLYIRKGVVPEFVRMFIQKHFLVKGE